MPTPLHNQITVSGTAQALNANPVTVSAYSIKAPLSNSATVYIGASTVTVGNGYPLEPGDVLEYELDSQIGQQSYQLRPHEIYAVGTGGIIAWFGSP